MILKLGEAGAVQLWVSSQVLKELENVLRRKAANTLGSLTLILDRSGVNIAPPQNRNFSKQAIASSATGRMHRSWLPPGALDVIILSP